MTIDASTLQLGQSSALPASPEEARLDRVPNPHAGTNYVARFTCPEFTSICPVTGQPDFGILVIDYLPGQWLVESKSLKLYLWSFRDAAVFAEQLAVDIATEVHRTAAPSWVEVHVTQRARGGIVTETFARLP